MLKTSLAQLQALVNNNTDFQIGEHVKKEDKQVTYVWQRNGVFEVRETSLGTFVIKTSKGTFSQLPDTLVEGVTLKVPKIPFNFFTQMVEFFKHVYKLYKTEVYVRVYYSQEKKEFYFFVPKQHLSSALAKWEDLDGEGLRLSNQDILVLQVHSHHNMHGSFSSIDDRDQDSLEGMHLVIGTIFEMVPSTQLRFCIGKYKINIDLEQVFDMPVEAKFNPDMFPKWATNCLQAIRTVSPEMPHRHNIEGYNPNDFHNLDFYNPHDNFTNVVNQDSYLDASNVVGKDPYLGYFEDKKAKKKEKKKGRYHRL